MEKKDNYKLLAKAVLGTGEENKRRTHSSNQYTTENQTHNEMKHSALKFLTRKCQNSFICEEYGIQLKRKYIMDVVSIIENKIISVECGDINSDKQSDFWDFFSNEKQTELYWLPYNSGRLFKITPVEESEKEFSEFKKYSKGHK